MPATSHFRIGWLIDGSGAPARRHQLLSLEDKTLVRIGAGASAHAHARPGSWYDLSEYTVLPTFVDAHVHLMLTGPPLTQEINARAVAPRLCPESQILRHLGEHLAYGVMAVRDGGDFAGRVLDIVQCDGFPKFPRIPHVAACGAALHKPGRYGRLMGQAVRNFDDIEAYITDRAAQGAAHVKIVQSGINSLREFGRQTQAQFAVAELRNISALARKKKMAVMVHANGAVPVATALAGGCDSVEHGYFMGDDNLKEMSDKGIVWVPTIVPMQACALGASRGAERDIARKTVAHQLRQLQKARDMGVRVAVGTDAGAPGVPHGQALARELALFVVAGYTVEEAIRCAVTKTGRTNGSTTRPALRDGGPASFLAVKGPPGSLCERLACRPDLVVVQGRAVSGTFPAPVHRQPDGTPIR